MATPFTRHISLRFRAAQAFYTGQTTSNLVPDIFPVAINGRPYQIDLRAGTFQRGFDPRVRDSVDQSTAPGEAAVNPQGLWRRGQDSWHLGAGQLYADSAESVDYMFHTSKGIDPWTKGQISCLKDTALNSASGAPTTATNQHLVVAGGYIYVSDGQLLKRASTAGGAWTTITSGALPQQINALASDGTRVFIAYANNGVYVHLSSGVNIATHITGAADYQTISYVNGRLVGGTAHNVHTLDVAPTAVSIHQNRDTSMRFVGSAAGNGFIYTAGFSGDLSIILKTTLLADATNLTDMSIAAQLPNGEVVSSIFGYLGFILIGSNKGVRFCAPDTLGNLTIGPLISTSGAVKSFTAEGNFVWFTYTNYDGTSGGLGRLDLSTFSSAQTPAFATDLMYTSTNEITSCVTFDGKRVFTVSGIGVVYEDSTNFVSTAEITTGIYRWGIPDRKFVAKFDLRTLPLTGTVVPSMSLDESAYTAMTGSIVTGAVESVSSGVQDKFIEAEFKLTFTRASSTSAPTLTRWMCRAYASPSRSQVFIVPVLLHQKMVLRNGEYFMNVTDELNNLRQLVIDPHVVNYQDTSETFSVVVEDVQFQAMDRVDNGVVFEGTATVTMRSITD